ncbi:MAG: dicarboxylate/amino acid:cation symporter, partial [Planctomycetota bacterium]
SEPPAIVSQMSERYERGNDEADAPDASLGTILLNLGQRLIPTNPFSAAAEGNTLGVIFFSVLLGLALVAVGEAGKPVIEVFNGLFEALILLVRWIIWVAPLGVFLLVAAKIGSVGLDAIAGPIASYMIVVLIGLFIHAMITLPGVLILLTRINPFRYLWALRKPVLFAFSTASSGATMPVTIEECQKSGGCSKQATNFVIPLGATINMDGTALYQGVAVVFLFQLYGIDLAFGDLLVILLTATFAAIGTAAVPSAGLITMAIVIVAVNSSLIGLGRGDQVLPLSAIGVILGIDRILDMCRTAVNVWGDAIGARVMTRLAPDAEEQRAEALS